MYYSHSLAESYIKAERRRIPAGVNNDTASILIFQLTNFHELFVFIADLMKDLFLMLAGINFVAMFLQCWKVPCLEIIPAFSIVHTCILPLCENHCRLHQKKLWRRKIQNLIVQKSLPLIYPERFVQLKKIFLLI